MEKVKYKWGSLPIGGGGFVTGLVAHPDDVSIKYIRTDVGGAYRWEPQNEEWIPLTDHFKKDEVGKYCIDGIALDKNNKDVLYICAGNHGDCDVLRSEDRGETWIRTGLNKVFYGNGLFRYAGEPIAVDPASSDIVFCGTRNDGLFKYSVKANKWTRVESVPYGERAIGIRTVFFDKYDVKDGKTQTIYAVPFGEGLYVSHNGGDSFERVEGSPLKIRRIAQKKDGSLLLASHKGLLSYKDGEFKNIGPAPIKFGGVDVHPEDDNKIVVSECFNDDKHFMNLPIHYTNDGGKTWRHVNAPERMRKHYTIPWWPDYYFASSTADIKFMPGGKNEVWFTDWYGTWVTEDIEAEVVDWYSKIKGHEEICAFCAVSPPEGDARLLTGVADNSGMRYENVYDYPPERRPLWTNGMDFCEKDCNFIAGVGAICNGPTSEAGYSTDNGKTWVHMENWNKNEVGMKMAVSADDPDNMVVLAVNTLPKYTKDRGETWHESKGAPEGLITSYWGAEKPSLSSDRAQGKVFYVPSAQGLYISCDGGAHFEMINEEIKYPGVIKTVPYRAGNIWYYGADGIKISEDYGKTFKELPGFGKVYSLDFGMGKTGGKSLSLYVFGVLHGVYGVFRSDDMGKTFIDINDGEKGLGNVGNIVADRKVYGRIYLLSGGRGIYMAEPEKQQRPF